MEVEKCSLEGSMRKDRPFTIFFVLFFHSEKLQELTRENHRVHDLQEELLIAKEVSVRLHSELEKSEETRKMMEKFNRTLKQQLDILKESLDEKSTNVKQSERGKTVSPSLFVLCFFRKVKIITIPGNYLSLCTKRCFANTFSWKN